MAKDTPLSGEPPGTVLLGSMDKRCYLFLCQSQERMGIERQNARQHGIQDPIDFVFEFDGVRYELSYEQLKSRLRRRSLRDAGFDLGVLPTELPGSSDS